MAAKATDPAKLLNKPVDHAGGDAFQAPSMRKVPLSGGNDGKSMMIDGPYGGKKPQS